MVYGVFGGQDHFIDGGELGMVTFYLGDRASTDPIELKAGRNGEEGNPMVEGPCFLFRTLSEVSQ
jgi:hypothetical protein